MCRSLLSALWAVEVRSVLLYMSLSHWQCLRHPVNIQTVYGSVVCVAKHIYHTISWDFSVSKECAKNQAILNFVTPACELIERHSVYHQNFCKEYLNSMQNASLTPWTELSVLWNVFLCHRVWEFLLFNTVSFWLFLFVSICWNSRIFLPTCVNTNCP